MRRLIGTLTFLLGACAAFAGPLTSCFSAVSSASGAFLVITDAEFSHSSPHGAERDTLKVVHGATHKVLASNMYWSSDFVGWNVVLTKDDSLLSTCPMLLISDDGNFLLLLSNDGVDSALRIYRRPEQGHSGVQVRDIPLKEIWPGQKWREWQEQHAMVMDGSSPEWFEGGTFQFSSDSRVLIHKTRWGNIVHIHLSDGTVSP
jgi:hypothetical protein